MKAYEAVAATLSARGTSVLFGVLAETNMHIVNSLVHRHSVRYVKAAREDGAVLMALGYARTTGSVGMATVTRGPGLTNAVTAITEAVRQRLPVVVVVGEGPLGDTTHAQYLDQLALCAPLGAEYRRLESPGDAVRDVVAALESAANNHRTVLLGVPTDVMNHEVEFVPVPEPTPLPVTEISETELDRAVGVMASAHRPVVLAGRGAVRSGAKESLLNLARRLGAPVCTTLGARQFFAGEPENLGVFGSVATPTAAELLAGCDAVIAFGASLNQHTAAEGSLTRERAIVRVDVDPVLPMPESSSSYTVVGDADAVARMTLRLLERGDISRDPWYDPQIVKAAPAPVAAEALHDYGTADQIDARLFTIALNALLPESRVVVCDVGLFMFAPLTWLGVPDPDSFVLPSEFSSIGVGLAAGIGAAVARPDAVTVVAAGDGGAMMSLTELAMARQEGLNLVYVVYNNRAYGAETTMSKARELDLDLTYFDWPDLATVGRAFGCAAVTVKGASDLPALEAAIKSGERPLVVDVWIDSLAPSHQ